MESSICYVGSMGLRTGSSIKSKPLNSRITCQEIEHSKLRVADVIVGNPDIIPPLSSVRIDGDPNHNADRLPYNQRLNEAEALIAMRRRHA